MAKIVRDEPIGKDGAILRIVRGQTLKQYMLEYGDDYREGKVWDFALSDIQNGAIEPQKRMIYWLIGDRLYETC